MRRQPSTTATNSIDHPESQHTVIDMSISADKMKETFSVRIYHTCRRKLNTDVHTVTCMCLPLVAMVRYDITQKQKQWLYNHNATFTMT